MIGRLRQLLEPRLRQQAGIEKCKIPVERDILVQWVRNVKAKLTHISGMIGSTWIKVVVLLYPLNHFIIITIHLLLSVLRITEILLKGP